MHLRPWTMQEMQRRGEVTLRSTLLCSWHDATRTIGDFPSSSIFKRTFDITKMHSFVRHPDSKFFFLGFLGFRLYHSSIPI